MRSLFPKILLSCLLTVFFVGVAVVLPAAVVIPSVGGGPLTLLIPLLAGVISGLICAGLARHITSPVVELRRGADAIARGTLTARVPASLRNRRDEIGQLGRDFDLMAERLESLVGSHKRLLGDVSHELRSPLSRLLVALGLARKASAAEMPELLDRIALEGQRLDNLIGQLLALSRIESGSEAAGTSPIDVTALVLDVVSDADFEARSQARQVVVTSSEDCMVAGSEELLRRAIENVVRNGVRHTAEGTAVEVSIRRERDRALVRIRDHGPGVPESMLPEMFLPFRRVQTGTQVTHNGAGLGLAIAHRAVSASGGMIDAKNDSGGGLVVVIGLPLSAHPAQLVPGALVTSVLRSGGSFAGPT